MNRLFEETIHRTEFPDEGLDAALWSPAADVYETPEEMILDVELPGVRLEDVQLEALDGKLRVSGVRRAEDRSRPRHFVRMERIYGSFSREFRFPPPSTPLAIKATLKSGVLRVARSESRAWPADPGRAAQAAMSTGSGRVGFRIGAISERFGIHPQTLRMYEREGLLRPARTEGNTRLYDADTIERLEIILTLTRHLGVNLAGVEVILHMKERMEKMQGEVRQVILALREEGSRSAGSRSLALTRVERTALVKK